jgi:hypothetical protein
VFDGFDGPSAICDPSHLEKRARYHLVKGCVCAGFRESSELLSIKELPAVLNLPRIVFSDLQITKMNEKLPRKLFAIKNIQLCLRHGLIRILPYCFPLCLFDTAIFEEKICRSDRLVLLKTSLAYFVLVLDWLDATEADTALPQRRGKRHPRVALWNRTFLIEMISTIFVRTRTLMDEADSDIDLFRLGTLSLERTFGALRQRSRDTHTFEPALTQVPAMQFLRFYRAEHYRITQRFQFDHVVCTANAKHPQHLRGVNPVRWARDALHTSHPCEMPLDFARMRCICFVCANESRSWFL